MRGIGATILGLSVSWAFAGPVWAEPVMPGSVLDRVKAQGFVRCGGDQTPGFGGNDADGRPTGFDTDFCRAIAAAVLGDADAIRTSRVSTAYKFDAVRDGDLDVSFGMTTWTFGRDSRFGTTFPAVTFHDGQGFMVWRDSGINQVGDIRSGTVCVQRGTTSAANLRDFLRDLPDVEVLEAGSSEDKMNAFAERRCDIVTGDRSELAGQRFRRAVTPEAWNLLSETISREPLGPVVAAADPQWATIVRWAVLVPLIAEARGVSAATVEYARDSEDQELRNLLGLEPDFGAELGLDGGWARRIIDTVGNYGDIFERNLGPVGLERGQNALWRDGGLFYVPPLR